MRTVYSFLLFILASICFVFYDAAYSCNTFNNDKYLSSVISTFILMIAYTAGRYSKPKF